MSEIQAQIPDRRANCFTLVRYIAAVNVFLLHITHMIAIPDWLYRGIRVLDGIPIFFTLSGFLIWMSLQRESGFRPFLRKRFFRLYPELWGGVALNAVAIILLYREKIRWPLFGAFQVTQATIFQQWTPDFLRGYGCGTPNGVLGSISVLIQSYLVLWLLFRLLRGRKPLVWGLCVAASMAAAAVFPLLEKPLPGTVYKVLNATFIPSLRMFLVGAMCAEFFDRVVPFLKKTWIVFYILFLAMKIPGVPDVDVAHPIAATLFLSLATIGFGYAFPKIQIRHDITYGMFIYHMVVMNAMIQLNFRSVPALILCFALTLLLAEISHRTLGRYSARMKTRALKEG